MDTPLPQTGSHKKWLILSLATCAVLGIFLLPKGFFSGLKAVVITDSSTVPVFVTTQRFTGKFNGIENANNACQNLAGSVALKGEWKAMLSSYFQNIADQLPDGKPFIRLDGVKIAGNKADLLDGTIQNPITTTESLSVYSGQVWTGTAPDGTAGNNFCQNKNGAASIGSTGSSIKTDAGWINEGALNCSQRIPIYCYQASTTDLPAEISSAQVHPDADVIAGTTTTYHFPTPLTGSVTLSTKNTIQTVSKEKATVQVKMLRNLGTLSAPKTSSSSSLKMFQIFEVTPSGDLISALEDPSTKPSFIEFELADSEVLASGFHQVDIRVANNHNGVWKVLPTPQVSGLTLNPNLSGDFIARYKVPVKEFSIFIVTGSNTLADPVCGNGTIDLPSEQCDGSLGVGPHQTCDPVSCQTITKTYCGDYKVQNKNDDDIAEQCDSGALYNGNDGVCTTTCQFVPKCGDHIKNQGGEECDDKDPVLGNNQSCGAPDTTTACHITSVLEFKNPLPSIFTKQSFTLSEVIDTDKSAPFQSYQFADENGNSITTFTAQTSGIHYFSVSAHPALGQNVSKYFTLTALAAKCGNAILEAGEQCETGTALGTNQVCDPTSCKIVNPLVLKNPIPVAFTNQLFTMSDVIDTAKSAAFKSYKFTLKDDPHVLTSFTPSRVGDLVFTVTATPESGLGVSRDFTLSVPAPACGNSILEDGEQCETTTTLGDYERCGTKGTADACKVVNMVVINPDKLTARTLQKFMLSDVLAKTKMSATGSMTWKSLDAPALWMSDTGTNAIFTPKTAGDYTFEVTVSFQNGGMDVTTPFTIKALAAVCGNTVIEAGEQCDIGAANGKVGNTCTDTCQSLAYPIPALTDEWATNNQ